MSLIACRECGHQISDKANSCPSCGAPFREKYPDQLNGYFYRVEKDRSVLAVAPSGQIVQFRDWQTFWNAAGGGDGINVSPDSDPGNIVRPPKRHTARNAVLAVISLLALLAVVGALKGNNSHVQRDYAKGSGADMVTDLGCKGAWSDDKKQVIFNSDYKGKLTTVTGKIVKAGDGEVELAILKSTLTYDLQVKLVNPREAYDLEKDQIITVRFVPTSLGGCILPFSGDEGVIGD
jgi:RNA polymerase subunit RPABC4/transcription elongation factor Spt4